MTELYTQGLGVQPIADEMGVTKTTISRRLRAAGVVMRPGGTSRKPVDDGEILRLRGEGLVWREVAVRVGMTEPGVHARWRRLRDAHGLVDPMPRVESDTARVVALYGQGVTIKAIADELSQSHSTVARTLKAAGVQVRRGVNAGVDDAELLRLRGEGLLWREVAERVGMTRAGVTFRWGLLRKAGHPDPGRKFEPRVKSDRAPG